MKNLGKANVRAVIYDGLAGIQNGSTNYNFDISASDWEGILLNSPYIRPLLTENVTDPGGTFSACFPSKRIFFANNRLFCGGNVL